MTIRQDLLRCLNAETDHDKQVQLIIGYMSCELNVDNGNGWYDNDPEMAEGGLDEAEGMWLKLTEPERKERIERSIQELAERWGREDRSA